MLSYVIFRFKMFFLKVIKVILKFFVFERQLPAFNIQPFYQVAQIFHTS